MGRRPTRPINNFWVVRLVVVGLLAAAFALPAASATAGSVGDDNDRTSNGLVVRTDDGLIRGRRATGVDNFLGIPYAAPPVDGLRWRPPQPNNGMHPTPHHEVSHGS